MTIKRLKELIANMPDDARIYLDDGYEFFKGNSEVVVVARGVTENAKKVVLQTKNDFDVSEELEARFDYYSMCEYD